MIHDDETDFEALLEVLFDCLVVIVSFAVFVLLFFPLVIAVFVLTFRPI